MRTNSALLARRSAAVPRGVSTATPIFADRAENAELWDVEGRRYVDFAGGIAVLNTGHRHPRVIAAVEAQLQRYTHTAFQVSAYEPYVALAERLNALERRRFFEGLSDAQKTELGDFLGIIEDFSGRYAFVLSEFLGSTEAARESLEEVVQGYTESADA